MTTPRAMGQGYFFGVPVGDLGWFASLLMSIAVGFMGFCAATFLGIVGIGIYNGSTHRSVDFALSYERFGVPAGLVLLVAALGYLGTLWVKRQLRRG